MLAYGTKTDYNMKKLIYMALVVLVTACDSGESNNKNQFANWSSVPSPIITELPTCDRYGNLDNHGECITDGRNISFKGRNSDGYIHVGKVKLHSIGGISNEFYLFKKGTKRYAATHMSGPFYSLSDNFVTIDNIKYKTS